MKKPWDVPRTATLAAVVLGMFAACSMSPPRPQGSSAHGKVSYEAVADKHLEHYIIEASQSTVAPSQFPRNAAPAYPAGLVQRKLPPLDVTALVIVDEKGRVSEVRIASEVTDDPVHRSFDTAVRKAVLGWRFTPFRIVTWQTDTHGVEHRVRSEPKPFSQIYRFHFAVHDGKPVVTSGTPQAHPV